MSDYAETMRSSRQTFRIPLDEFLKKCDPHNSLDVFCFVEATEDKWFYNSKIRSILNFSPYTISCKNKKNVLLVYQELNVRKEYKSIKIGYFVDRDFSDHVPTDVKIDWNKIYVTPFYSIENFYVQSETLQNILDDVFNLQLGSVDYTKALKYFTDAIGVFHKKILDLNTFLCCQFIIDPDGKINKLNIDDRLGKIFDTIISPDFNQISDFPKIESKNKLETLYGTSDIEINFWNEKKIFFQNEEPTKVFRGKFEVKFLFAFLITLKNSLLKGSQSGWTKIYKPEIQIVRNELLKSFVDKIIAPSCLIEYTKRLS